MRRCSTSCWFRAGKRLPGSGAVQYLADRYPGRRWLRNEDAHKDNRWRDLIEGKCRASVRVQALELRVPANLRQSTTGSE